MQSDQQKIFLKEQMFNRAYSYAIHPEVKCQHFSLCNARSLVLFNVDDADPLLLVHFSDYEAKWTEIERHLAPRFLKQPLLRQFDPDFGSALKRMGLREGAVFTIIGAQFNVFARVSDELMTAISNCEFADRPHCTSFDFHPTLLPSILEGLPTSLANQFRDALSRAPFQAAAELAIEVDIDTHLGKEIEGGYEVFIPLIIDKVRASRFNHTPLAKEATDIPDNVFRLRKAYKIKTSGG